MKVILTQDIRGKGKRGQMIEVSDGYARNYLFPKKLAQEANADNLNTMRMNDKAKQEREAKERAEAMEISKRMKGFTVTVTAKGGGPSVRLRDQHGDRRGAGRAAEDHARQAQDRARRADQDGGRLHRPLQARL